MAKKAEKIWNWKVGLTVLGLMATIAIAYVAYLRYTPPPWVGGKITTAGDKPGLTAGYSVKVVVKNSNSKQVASQTVILDAQGSASYLVHSLPLGALLVSVEQGPGVSTSSGQLNICFDGTDPVWQAVTLAPGSNTATGRDFSLKSSIAFNMSQPCWP